MTENKPDLVEEIVKMYRPLVGDLTKDAYQQYIRKVIADGGYVRLDENQDLPPNPFAGKIDIWQNIRLATRQGYDRGQQDMLAAGFERVIQPEKVKKSGG